MAADVPSRRAGPAPLSDLFDDVLQKLTPTQHRPPLLPTVMPRRKQILTSLKTSRIIKILPSASTLNSSWKKTTGTYQKLPMILIYSAVTYIVRLRSTG
jgi:hypothetical protein